MGRWFFVGIALTALLPIAARAGDPGPALFSFHGCRRCHRIGAAGGDAGPDLTFVGLRRSEEWLGSWLADPRAWKKDARMPNLYLRAVERKALAHYLSTLRGDVRAYHRPWEALRGDPVRAGRMVYLKAGCVACHGPGGAGGEPNNNVPGGLIPALRELAHTYTADELKSRIRNGSRPAKDDPSGLEPKVSMPSWAGALSDWEIDAVSAYLLTLEPSSKDLSW